MDVPSLVFWILMIWAAGLLLLFLIGRILSALTLRSISRTLSSDHESGGEKSIRTTYRRLINVAAIYYYASLPIIAVIILAVIVGAFYLFFEAGRVPLKLAFLLVAGGGVTLYKMVATMFVKIPQTDPGRALSRDEAPELFAMAQEVAQDVGTRTIDEIRITPGTELAVYERGNRREKAMDNACRVLLLGAGVLRDFREPAFRSVLAHEYGHFSHRDTAGGEIALRVQGDMFKYFVALYQAGLVVWWNVAVQFLRLYNILFRRISHGATRLQEVLADRVAAQLYGAAAFRNGLTHVITRSIQFQSYVEAEVRNSQANRIPVRNLYEPAGPTAASLKDQVDAELNAETTEDDTHPSPKDRFRYIARYETSAKDPSDRLVVDMFTNFQAIGSEMTNLVNALVNGDNAPKSEDQNFEVSPPPAKEPDCIYNCSECGAKVHPEARACQVCGVKFDAASPDERAR